MLNVTCTVTVTVEDRAEAVEFANELKGHYDDKPDVKVSSLSTDSLEAS